MSQRDRKGRHTARKAWAQALFDLGAMVPEVKAGRASHEDVSEAVARVDNAASHLKEHA